MSSDRISLLHDPLINYNSSNLSHYESSGYDTLGNSGQVTQNAPPTTYESAKKLPQFIAAITATLSALAAGFVLGWTSPIMDELEHKKFNHISVNLNQMGWIGSFVALGAMTMCLPTGFICDLIGRKKTLLLLIIPFGVGWALIFFANSVLMLYFGRLITGMAVGASCVAAPLYTNEIAQKEIRGTLGSYFQLMITAGIFLAYLFGKYLTPIQFTVVCMIAPLLFFICFVFQPESPVYCLKRGRYNDAQISLTRLRGERYNVAGELVEMEGALKERNQVSVSLMQVLQLKATKKAIFMSLSLMFFQQFSGINAYILYDSNIFASASTKLDANSATIIVGGFQVVATFISSLLVDKLGRRILLGISGLIMAISTTFLAAYFTLQYREKLDPNILSHLAFIPVLAVCLFIVVFSIGFGPIPWMFASEIFSPDIRSLAASVAGTFNWFMAFLITKFYLQVQDAVGKDTTFYVFAICSLVSTFFVYYVVPETKGKSVEEIQNELGQ